MLGAGSDQNLPNNVQFQTNDGIVEKNHLKVEIRPAKLAFQGSINLVGRAPRRPPDSDKSASPPWVKRFKPLIEHMFSACRPSPQGVAGRGWEYAEGKRLGFGAHGADAKTDGGSACLESRRVIGPTGAVRVMVATKPVDFAGAEGLSALVRETMMADPFSGAVYVFRAKRADRIKLIFWDGTGLCLFAKRLEDGIFRWPKIEDGVMRLSAAQLSALLEGLDWRRVHEARETATPVQPG
jgi:transposase